MTRTQRNQGCKKFIFIARILYRFGIYISILSSVFRSCIIKKANLFYLKAIYNEHSTTTINEFSQIYFTKGELRGKAFMK